MLLIFDWDGTLSDSTARIIQCMQLAAESAGFDAVEDQAILNIIGLGLPEAMQQLYPTLKLAEKERIRQEYTRHFLTFDQTPSPFFHGVEAGLNILRDNGFQMAVATGKSRKGLQRVLELTQSSHYFTDSRCADETASKPDPLMLNELLQVFEKSPEQAIMVGDTEYDMEMARQIGIHRVAVSYGAHHIDRLHPYQPLLCVDHFSEFVNWVLSTYR